MGVFDWIRLIAGSTFLAFGLVIFFTEVFGAFHFHYVLNRMHVAAMGDTLGIASSLIGLIIFSGINFTSLKLLLIIVFLWFASPVSSHVLARLEVATNENLESYCEVYTDIESLEAELVAETESGRAAAEADFGDELVEPDFEDALTEVESGEALTEPDFEDALEEPEFSDALEESEFGDALEEPEFRDALEEPEFGDAGADTQTKGGAS